MHDASFSSSLQSHREGEASVTPIPTIDLRGGHQDDGSRLNTDYGERMRDSEHSRGCLHHAPTAATPTPETPQQPTAGAGLRHQASSGPIGLQFKQGVGRDNSSGVTDLHQVSCQQVPVGHLVNMHSLMLRHHR